jgi:hypothetical protein
MRKWELWEDEGGSSFFPESNMQARLMAMEDGLVKVWEVEASSTNDAMRAMNERLGWGPYKPMLQDDGTPFPEDEDDEVMRELEGEFFDAPWSAWCSTAGKRVLVPCGLEAEEILRQGGFEWQCSACGQTHRMIFRAPS